MKMKSRYPDFFIVGTVKAGTTSLYHYLKQHPQVFVPNVKELHFFAREIDPKYFIQGYGQNNNTHIQFLANEQEYLQHYENAGDRLKGDFAPSNLWSKESAKEIHRVNQDAKIIAIIRQPIERAFSHWLMDLKSGLADTSFVNAFEQHANSKEKHWGNNRLYKQLSLYADSLQRYYDFFPPKQILVIDYDELRDTNAVYNSVLKFLQLEDHLLQHAETHNQSTLPRYAALDTVYKSKIIRKQLKQLLPANAISWMKQNLLSTKRLPKLSTEDRVRLMPHFEHDIKRLGGMLNRDFNHWLR